MLKVIRLVIGRTRVPSLTAQSRVAPPHFPTLGPPPSPVISQQGPRKQLRLAVWTLTRTGYPGLCKQILVTLLSPI